MTQLPQVHAPREIDETIAPSGCEHVWRESLKLWYYSPAIADKADLAQIVDFWAGGYLE
jgi:hypothetical protein